MEAHLQSFIDYFSAHPSIAMVAIFAAAMLEAFAFIGTFIPGSSIVFIGGVLIGLNVLDPWWAVIAAVTGAAAGDSISYWLGHHYREQLRTIWPMKSHPELFARGQHYFEANGGKSIFFGRFLGPVRAIVPVIAGMSGMAPMRFAVINVASALAWAAAHMLPGVLFGASLQLAGAVSSRLVGILLILVVLGWLLYRGVHFLFRIGWPKILTVRDSAVARARHGSGLLSRTVLSLFDPTRPESQALLIAAVLLIAGVWLFSGVVQDVVANDPLVRFDHVLNNQIQGLRTHWGDHFMVAFTEVGGPAGTIALVVTLSLYFAYRRYWRTLGYWIGATAIAEGLVWAVKFTLGRARPHNIYTGIEQYSFPSGHTTLSIVIYGFMAFLLANNKPAKQKLVLTVIAAAIIGLISFSRMYLGVHWFSDVLGSLSLGLIWVSVLSIAYTHHVTNQRLAVLPFSAVVASTLLAVSVFYTGDRHARDLARYAYEVPAVSMTVLSDWTVNGWRQLPTARSEIEGDVEEPFVLQWAGSAEEIATLLGTARWQTPQPWSFKAMFLWLLPHTPITQLPVMPKFNQGQAQRLSFVKIIDQNERAVIRLWPSQFVVPAVHRASDQPLWYGSLTTERRRALPHLGTLLLTEPDAGKPVGRLQKDLLEANITTRPRNDNEILLIGE